MEISLIQKSRKVRIIPFSILNKIYCRGSDVARWLERLLEKGSNFYYGELGKRCFSLFF